MPDQDWEQHVLLTYREVVADAGHDGLSIKEIRDDVLERLSADVASGRIAPPDWRASVAPLVDRLDDGDGRKADRLLADLSRGDALDIVDDPAKEVVVTLGRGARKSWRYITLADIEAMDDLRYENARAAQNSYDEFRRTVTRPWTAVLKRHATAGDAVDAGDFPMLEVEP